MSETMRFRNFGGMHQFVVTDENDLARIDALDPARWAATSAPLRDLHTDPAFLAFLDEAGTGRLRVSQLVAAREFVFERLANRARLREKSDVLYLSDLSSSEPAGKLRAAAEQLIAELKLEAKDRISLGSVRAFRDSYRKTLANGDGIVPADYLPEPDAAQLVKDVAATVGTAKDASELDGVGAAQLDDFLAKAKGWLDWRAEEKAALVWGEDTAPAAALVAALDAKIEEFFWHCDLLRQEAQSADVLRLSPEELRALHGKAAEEIEKYLAGSPLSTPLSDGTLALGAAINPVYRAQFEELRAKVLGRALPQGTLLSRASWRQVKATFDAWNAWQARKPAEPFDALGEDRVRAILDGKDVERVRHFMALDAAAAPGLEQVSQLEKLILFQRGLLELANNFVNFSAVYRPTEQALIEKGSLVIDGRRLDFCIEIADRGAHKTVASGSLIFLVYAQVFEKDGSAPAYEVMAPVTGGERGRLRVGKRGIFIDTAGKEWDAVIVEVVEYAISVWEAAIAPFRRVQTFVGQKIQDWVGSQQASQEKALDAQAASAVSNAEKTAEDAAKDAKDGKVPPPPPPPKKEAEGLNVNSLVLGGGMALAGLGAVLAGLFGMLTSLKGWAAILGIVAAVMGISALLGWLKLRRRDMSLVFEASGWAVNIEMKINRRIARVFTFTPDLPPGSVKERLDELKTKDDEGNGGTIFLLLVLVAVAGFALWYYRHQLGR